MAGRPMRYEVPGWGVGELWMRGPVVLAHEFRYDLALARAAADARPPEGADAPPTGTLAPASARRGNAFASSGCQPIPSCVRESGDDPASRLVERFRSFLAGEAVDFGDVEVDLTWTTPFQRQLTSALRAIPWGEVVTYGELAALAGRPGAARAAGTFCATNRFAIVVPCHRVVAASGIGGYGADGVPIKRRLLALEGVRV